MRGFRVAVASMTLLFTASAAVAVEINNGLAPPNPANVIDAANSFPEDFVAVFDGGCIDPGCVGTATTVAVLDGGVVAALVVSGTSALQILGGEASNLQANESASILMSGGVAPIALQGFDSSSVALSGGTVFGLVGVHDTAMATITGGLILPVDGAPPEMLLATGSATMKIFGSGFAVNGAPVGFGLISLASGTLTGTLLSGDPIDAVFCHAGCTDSNGGGIATGQITLVPEPSTAVLLIAGLLTLGLRGRMHG